MALTIKKAVKLDAKLRMALYGPSGSGKTYTALLFARALAGPDGRILVVDSEHGSASKYVGMPGIGGFDVIELSGDFSPTTYKTAAIMAGQNGYDVLVIDSLSHAWTGAEGALDQVDKKARYGSGNTFNAWKDVTPQMREMTEAIIAAPLHVIATMRAKTDYVQETGANGKTAIRKVGLGPIMGKGIEYEFDIVGVTDLDNGLMIEKTRCFALRGKHFHHPGAEVMDAVKDWLTGADTESREQSLDALRARFLALEDGNAVGAESRMGRAAMHVSGGIVGRMTDLPTEMLLEVERLLDRAEAARAARAAEAE